MKKQTFNLASAFLLALSVVYVIVAVFAFFLNDVSITGFVTLNKSITEQDASIALADSKQIIEDMSKTGLRTARAIDLLEEARREMSLKNYERVILISEEIRSLKNKALQIQDNTKNISLMINEAKKSGINATEAEVLLNLSVAEFALENYEGSEDYLQSSFDKLGVIMDAEIKTLITKLNSTRKISLDNELNITRLHDTLHDAQNLKTFDIKKLRELNQEFNNLNKSISILIEADKDINAMSDAGLPTKRINDVLNEAKFALELGYYNKIEELGNDIRNLKEKAFRIGADLEKTKNKIEDAKRYALDISEVEQLFNSSQNEFKLENYEEADKLLKQSLENAERIIADSLLFGTISKSEIKFNLINFLKRFWWAILIFFAISLVFGIFIFQRISIAILKNRLRNLEKEKNAITNLIKDAQTAYFKENKMDKSMYNLKVNKYQDRLIQIRVRIPLLNDKLARKKEKAWKFKLR